MGLLTKELNDIYEKQQRVLADVVADLFAELQRRTPVDTGELKIAWELTRTNDGWLISNNMEYASIIFDGRKLDDSGVMRGSEQLPDGIIPILDKYNRILEIKLRKI